MLPIVLIAQGLLETDLILRSWQTYHLPSIYVYGDSTGDRLFDSLTPMKCIVTAGPTYESIDQVRRITNFSTGKLGAELAKYLHERGWEVCLMIGAIACYRGTLTASKVVEFTSTADLLDKLTERKGKADAVFHAAAVSDFTCKRIFQQLEDPAGSEINQGKIPTSIASLFIELVPTPKIIRHLREMFPKAFIAGWKYEVDTATPIEEKARRQIAENQTDVCVLNGPAYGPGFGIVQGNQSIRHLEKSQALYELLFQMGSDHTI